MEIVVSGLVSSALTGTYPAAQRALDQMFSSLPTITTTTFKVQEHYVSRPSLEKRILDIYESSFVYGYDSFHIVAGAKGAGKSTVVEQNLYQMPGVMRVGVSEADTEKSVLCKILLAGGEHVEENINLDLDVLQNVFLDAAEQSSGRRITVVLEVERGTDANRILYMVQSSAKKLARFANVIVVLSEANAALMFGDDRRQKFIWVDGMTPEEASMYAKKVFPAIADHDLALFFDKVGILDQSLKTAHPYKP